MALTPNNEQIMILKLNNVNITRRESDGYINATELCKAGGKLIAKYNENIRSKAFIKVLSLSIRIRIDELVKYTSGDNSSRATWVHPQVAINIAQWISPEFDVQVSAWIYQLLAKGKVELENRSNLLQQENIRLLEEKKKSEEEIKQREQTLKEQQKKLKQDKLKARKELFETHFCNKNISMKNEWIYIAASKEGYRKNMNKLGTAIDPDKRIGSYNTGRQGDEIIHYLWYAKTVNGKAMEKLLFSILQPWRVKLDSPGAKDKDSASEVINMPLPSLIAIVKVTMEQGEDAGLCEAKLRMEKYMVKEAETIYKENIDKPNLPSYKPILTPNKKANANLLDIVDLSDREARKKPEFQKKLLQLASEFVNTSYHANPPCEDEKYREENEAFELPIPAFKEWLVEHNDPSVQLPIRTHKLLDKFITKVLDEKHKQIIPIDKVPNNWPPEVEELDNA